MMDTSVKSVALHTLGCKLNYSETSTLAKQFESRGFKIKNYGDKSDVFVLNTCSVTENADKECRQIVRSILRQNPDTYIIVTGCYAQLQPDEIASINGVDVVLGANEKFKLFDYIQNFEKNDVSCVFRSPETEIKNINGAYSADIDSRTRAFLKIQDGCDYKCSFCTIPLARGKSRSLPINEVLDNAKKIIDAGYKEIILTGVNTGDYNHQLAMGNEQLTYKLIDVLYMLEKLDIQRIRISSIEPNLLNDEIIDLVSSSKKFCNHFHIPLQSGDKDVLKLMRRRYTNDYYENLIYKLNDKIKDVGIGVDVITGFPGETKTHFENTYNFLESLPISYLHVFTYSERRNTTAVTLPGRVEISERRHRSEQLRTLSTEKRSAFYSKYIGTKQSVLFEAQKNDGTVEGYTTNYIRVKVDSENDIENQISDVILESPNGALPVTAKIMQK
ncbi:MAG TPA: tRNA (N(6)-L-threonylcarbamoyladenosine(37)-C(2))-methylthiotransferase MtaB [Ignavibacteria bacterium]|nr:tRNA (N(6)-L-threonylcarbamoyladenosine(37)-C(2))-methylthiotransferase MtaB [Ignavibacteria bacterium]